MCCRNRSCPSLIRGSPAKDWWAKQGRDLGTRLATQLRLGVAAGETNDQLVRRLRGTQTGRQRTVQPEEGPAKKLPVYSGGVFDGSAREAMALVRTSVQTISNAVAANVYEENRDILRGKALSVTLDNKTTLTCIALSGGAWTYSNLLLLPFPSLEELGQSCLSCLCPCR